MDEGVLDEKKWIKYIDEKKLTEVKVIGPH
jgi:hypothetical protein